MSSSAAGPGHRLAVTERMPAGDPLGPPLVFLHGLACERGQFAAQLDGLDPRLRLLTIDLPGHGDSPQGSGEPTLAGIADVVSDELVARGIAGALVVGHSAGGLVGLHLASRHPGLASGLVVIDTNTALSPAARAENKRALREAEAGDWRTAFTAAMAESWGPEDGVPADVRDRVFASIRSTPERAARPLWREILLMDPTGLWRRCPVPARYIRSRRATDLVRLRGLNRQVDTVDLQPQCNGHWPHLQRPDLVNPLLEAIVTARPDA